MLFRRNNTFKNITNIRLIDTQLRKRWENCFQLSELLVLIYLNLTKINTNTKYQT